MNFDRLEKFQNWLCDEWRIPGNTCIAYVGGKEVYRHSAGFNDRENNIRMRGDELFYVYSITKTVTTLAALQLLEKGLFHLNDGLDMYMPEFHNPKVKSGGKVVDAKGWIRVRDLFSMTAGYDYDLCSDEINKHRNADGTISTLEMAKGIAETPLTFNPGEDWLYSVCHDVLAAFVEKVSGQRFADYVKENIFDPCGMKDSCFHMDEEEKLRRMAQQYQFNDSTGMAKVYGKKNDYVFGDCYDSGGAGLISTADDMAKYAKVLAAGGITDSGERIISRRTIDLWRTNTLNEKQLKSYNWDGLCGYGYGLGVRTHMNPAESGSLSPLGEFGWSGAAGGFIMVDPENEVGLFYVHHMLNNQEWFTVPRIRNIFYSCL